MATEEAIYKTIEEFQNSKSGDYIITISWDFADNTFCSHDYLYLFSLCKKRFFIFGRTINEPVAANDNFVMNPEEEVSKLSLIIKTVYLEV